MSLHFSTGQIYFEAALAVTSVLVSMLLSNAINHGFEHQFGQTKVIKI